MAGIKVSGGSKISLVMNPVLIESTQPVKSLNLKQRQCGIPSDIDKNHYLFKVHHIQVNPMSKPLYAQEWGLRGEVIVFKVVIRKMATHWRLRVITLNNIQFPNQY